MRKKLSICGRSDVLQFSIIGSGTYARVHARTINSDRRAKLKWVWSPTPANRKRFAEEFGVSAAETYQQAIEDTDVGAVSIATADFAHTKFAVAALDAGKDVLIEKPLATSVEECRQILAARDRSGRKLMVNYHNRWYPAFRSAREAVVSGRIGKPVAANFVLSDTISWVLNNMRWADKTGPEWFLMSHIADLACWILGDRPIRVFAEAYEGVLRSKGFPTRDIVKAQLRMKKGAIVHLESSWILAPAWRNNVNEMWLSVQGETGRVDANADQENLILVTDRFETPFQLLDLTEKPPIVDFISAVVEGKPIPVTGEEGLLATQIVEAVVRSYKSGEVVHLE